MILQRIAAFNHLQEVSREQERGDSGEHRMKKMDKENNKTHETKFSNHKMIINFQIYPVSRM